MMSISNVRFGSVYAPEGLKKWDYPLVRQAAFVRDYPTLKEKKAPQTSDNRYAFLNVFSEYQNQPVILTLIDAGKVLINIFRRTGDKKLAEELEGATENPARFRLSNEDEMNKLFLTVSFMDGINQALDRTSKGIIQEEVEKYLGKNNIQPERLPIIDASSN